MSSPQEAGHCATATYSPFYPLYFKLQGRWLLSFTPVTYLCKLLGTHSFAALLGLRPRPYGASASAVQSTSAL
ncbi:hypothetical protein CWM85_41335, partial [Klebsiella michiganensis]